MTLGESLRGIARVALDTGVFIEYAEQQARSIAVLVRLFERIQNQSLVGVTSAVTLAEFLAENESQKESFAALLALVEVVPVSREIARRASDLRSTYGLKTPDALHVATALESGCQAIVTSDASDMLRVSGEIRVIVPYRLTR